MNEIPTWTIVLGIIGLLVNAVIGLLIWTVSQKLGDIKESIVGLAAADRELGKEVGVLAKELADHKLHVSETYVRLELHTSTTTSIFNAMREVKEEIVERVQELMRHLETKLKAGAELR